MSGLFERTDPSRRHYSVAVFVGIIAGLISAFVNGELSILSHRAAR